MTAVKSIGLLTIATMISQGLMLLSLFLMVKGFSQADIGVYSIFASATAIISLVTMLAYELILPNIEEDDYAPFIQGLLLLACLSASVLWLLASLSEYSLPLELTLAVFGVSGFRLIEYTSIRKGTFRTIFLVRTLPAFTLLLWVVLARFQYAEDEIISVIHGYSLTISLLVVLLFFLFLNEELLQRWQCLHAYRLLRGKIKHALHVAPSSLLNTLSYNLPVIFLGKYFGEEIAAQYNIILRFCFGPVSLLGDAIGKVYHSYLGQKVRSGERDAYSSYRRIRLYLLIMGAFTGIGIAVTFPFLLPYFFGEEWALAGQMGLWMSPLFAVMLCVAPLTVSLYVFEQSAYIFKSQLVYFIISMFSFYVGIVLQDIFIAIVLFTWLSFLRYWHIWHRIQILSFERLR